MKLLIIEKDPDIYTQFKECLDCEQYDITTASNGKEGLDLFRMTPNSFSVILTDITMPVMDGLTFIKKIREEDSHIPIILITEYTDFDITLEALHLGAYDLFVKPIQFTNFKERLKNLQELTSPSDILQTVLPTLKHSTEFKIHSQTSFIYPMANMLSNNIRWLVDPQLLNSQHIRLCLQESLSNAIIHGNLNISSELKEKNIEEFEARLYEREHDPKYNQKSVFLTMNLTSDMVHFTIEDQGDGFDTSNLPKMDDPENWLREYGRGILLIQSLMDEVSWNERGNCISIKKKIRG